MSSSHHPPPTPAPSLEARDEGAAPGTGQPGPGGARSGHGRTLLRDSTIYVVGNLLQKSVAFVLIPLYTHALSPAQYGLLELANTVVNLVLVVAALGVPSAINKCFHRDCDDASARGRLAFTAFVFSIGIALALAIAGWSFEARLAGALFAGPDGPLVYRFTLVWLVLAQVAVIPFEWLRAAGRARLYVGLSVVQLAVQFITIVVLVRWAHWGLAGVLTGSLSGFVVVNVVGGVLLARQAVYRFDRRLLAAMIAYGVAMIPVFVSSWIVNLSDRFFVQSLVGLQALGIYALGYKLGALVDLLLVMPFQRAWTPIFFRMAGDPRAPENLSRVTSYLLGGLGLASLAVSLGAAPFIRLSATPEYQGAAGIVPFICLAYLIAGLANCLGNGLVVAGKLRTLAMFAALAAVTNLVLNVLLIPRLGVYGAAAATILAFAIQLGGILVSLARHYPVPLEWRRLAGFAFAFLAPLATSWFMPPMPLAVDVAARLALLSACPILVVALGLIRPRELGILRQQLVDWRLLSSTGVRVAEDGPADPGGAA